MENEYGKRARNMLLDAPEINQLNQELLQQIKQIALSINARMMELENQIKSLKETSETILYILDSVYGIDKK